jgi:hypothetical protein
VHPFYFADRARSGRCAWPGEVDLDRRAATATLAYIRLSNSGPRAVLRRAPGRDSAHRSLVLWGVLACRASGTGLGWLLRRGSGGDGLLGTPSGPSVI